MKEKILLVDDEEGIRKVLGISLADRGYEVYTAENGEKALQIFRENKPSIVLTDIKMPGMDGVALLEKIKAENPDTEVVMITGHGDMDLAIKSLQRDAVDFVTKPINDDVLEIALKRANEKITMREQLRAYTENLETLVKQQSAKLIEAERKLAVGQAIEGLSSAIKDIADDLEGGIRYFNEMPCFVSIHSRELKIIETNQLYRERLGDKLAGSSWEIYTGKDRSAASCPVAKTFKTGQGRRSRANIQYADGNVLPVIVYTAPIRNKEGQLELVLEIAADISEINRLQEELRTTQRLYQQLFDEVPCYITVQDRDFRLTATNRRFKDDFPEAAGTRCFEVYKHRSETCPDCPVAKTFADGKSHQSEMVVTAKTGEQYHVLVWTAPIRNAAGEIEQVMEMSTNITQIRQLQDHLSSLGFLISTVSHGIKGLLTGLDGGMYLLDSGFAKENQQKIKEGWEIVKLMVGRIRGMVQDILYYAKERDLKWEKVDVLSFAEEVAQTIEPKLRAQEVKFIRDFDHSLGVFEVDAGIVQSALMNILENALEAIMEDNSQKKYQVVFGARQDNNHIIFDVTDNGIGMDRETRENLFNLFFSSKGTLGTGLGLFISNKIIQQHDGLIEVESTPGKGSRFRIKIPKILPETAKYAKTDQK
ncbi:MAG: response regulator [Desulfobacterales bacterium]|jgi:PAS domain S-box-containing protein